MIEQASRKFNAVKCSCESSCSVYISGLKCEIRPLTIHVDYIPHRVNLVALQGGNYAELLNLISWKVTREI
ncbi:hypothetical protein SUGI_0397720 [Cryptomeria japonica]|nr:hypothetical protein SUGI_0397720 [Cryptomeria japonica]